MRTLQSSPFLVLSVWLLAAASCAGTPANPPENLEQTLERIRAQHDLPGLAAAVVRGGETVSSAVSGARSLSSGARLHLDDRFHIASCTKSMTATLAAARCGAAVHGRGLTLRVGFPILDDNEAVGHIEFFDETFLAALNVADALVSSPRDLAWLLDAAGGLALDHAGKIALERATEAA
jgi:hypothetical protein